MKKIVCSIFIIILLFTCSMFLASCDAVTAQNITNNGSNSKGLNGGQGKNK